MIASNPKEPRYAVHKSDNWLDEQKILRRFDNNISVLVAVINVYLNDYERQLKLLDVALIQKSFSDLEVVAHSLKGAAGNFSDKLVVRVVAQIEALAKKHDGKRVRLAVPILHIEARLLKEELLRLLAKFEGSHENSNLR